MTPEAQAHAREQVRAWQERQREHLAEHDYLKRQYGREGIGRGFDGNPDMARAIAREKANARRATPTRTPEPESTTPKLDRLPRLNRPEDPVGASERTNPAQALERGFQVNCSYVVNAVELRARGIDVIARARPGGSRATGRNNYEIAADWLTPDGDRATFEYMPKGTSIRNVGKRLAEAAQDWPVGARGFVSAQWKGTRSGHIWNVERTAVGLRHIEGQIADVTPEQAEGYLQNVVGSSVGIMRTDNLVPTDSLDDAVEARTVEREREIRAELLGLLAAARDELADAEDRLAAHRRAADAAYERMVAATDAAERLRAARDAQRANTMRNVAAATVSRLRSQVEQLERSTR